ncbi:MAG: hypothetical protein P8183_19580, partial [Anaerolineae bacterium]
MIHKMHFVFFVSVMILAVLFIATQTVVTPINAEQSTNLEDAPSSTSTEQINNLNTTASPYNCRYGLSSLSSLQNQWLDYFKAGWTLSFGSSPSGTSDLNAFNSTFTPVVHIKQVKDSNNQYLNDYYTIPSIEEIRQIARDYPGKLWFLGNEPDRVVVQDDIYPQMYAVGFHDVAAAIKEEDPTALIANAGLIQPTPGRLQYLDIMWDTYLALYNEPMPVDVWNMHGYILSVKAPDGSVGPARVALGTDPALAVLGSDLT